MPEIQASKPQGTALWEDDELLREVLMCASGDTFDGLARRLGYQPETLEDRLREMGQLELIAKLKPISLNPGRQPGPPLIRRAAGERRIRARREQRELSGVAA